MTLRLVFVAPRLFALQDLQLQESTSKLTCQERLYCVPRTILAQLFPGLAAAIAIEVIMTTRHSRHIVHHSWRIVHHFWHIVHHRLATGASHLIVLLGRLVSWCCSLFYLLLG